MALWSTRWTLAKFSYGYREFVLIFKIRNKKTRKVNRIQSNSFNTDSKKTGKGVHMMEVSVLQR